MRVPPVVTLDFGPTQWEAVRFDHTPQNDPSRKMIVPHLVAQPLLEIGTTRPFDPKKEDVDRGVQGEELAELKALLSIPPEHDVIAGRPAVVMHDAPQRCTGEGRKLIILWIKEWQEWIVLKSRYHFENHLPDETFVGPWAFGAFCMDILLRAYGVRVGVFNLETLRRTSPEYLCIRAS